MPRFADFDASSLRRSSTQDHFPWSSRTLTLIRVSAHGVVTQATSDSEKRRLLDEATKKDMILAAWPGQWRQDVFWVDDIKAARAAL
ncbi:hypothetical protein ACFC96_44700 [Streptomyces sp. NPDC055955]|uniref:hypothetical protein n=1 Tax=Streptomyces sp. NPDC055955 TaxID=3345665 RepID=UPI0035DF405A